MLKVLGVAVILGALVYSLLIWLVPDYYSTPRSVADWDSKMDSRFETNVTPAVMGKTRQQVVSLLGAPDSPKPAIMDVMRCFKSAPETEVIYYYVPGPKTVATFLQAVEFTNGRVTSTYRTYKNACWLIGYPAMLLVIVLILNQETLAKWQKPAGPG